MHHYPVLISLSLSHTHTHPGAMWFSGGKLAVGSVSGSLALWSLGAEEGGRGREKVAPALSVSQETQLQLGSGIFSLSFDQDMKLVSKKL